ncbi:hypothetical protein QLG07_02460 [Erwinia sp. V90_4]|uniref:hypothetical protein n=1 Tax=Erwinia sp. V90_4 TaxID=3044239 RepID=UPI00249E10BE|nr:hypothetical protein [Erwinia sp. V90_4]MDI3438320.1 hypothetical protein [Erwinia sp. V90_4]
MNKKQLAILEKAWGAEISCALNEIPLPIIQTRSKVAKQLADDGYLDFVRLQDGVVTFEGYQINHAGIHAYCESIPEDFDIEAAEAEMRAGLVKS